MHKYIMTSWWKKEGFLKHLWCTTPHLNSSHHELFKGQKAFIRGVQLDLAPDQPAQPGPKTGWPDVGNESSPLKPKTDRSVDEFEHEKPIFNWPDRKTHWNFCSPLIGVVSGSDFVWSVEIWRDLVEIWPDLFEIQPVLVEISSRSNLISLRSTKISLRPDQI